MALFTKLIRCILILIIQPLGSISKESIGVPEPKEYGISQHDFDNLIDGIPDHNVHVRLGFFVRQGMYRELDYALSKYIEYDPDHLFPSGREKDTFKRHVRMFIEQKAEEDKEDRKQSPMEIIESFIDGMTVNKEKAQYYFEVGNFIDLADAIRRDIHFSYPDMSVKRTILDRMNAALEQLISVFYTDKDVDDEDHDDNTAALKQLISVFYTDEDGDDEDHDDNTTEFNYSLSDDNEEIISDFLNLVNAIEDKPLQNKALGFLAKRRYKEFQLVCNEYIDSNDYLTEQEKENIKSAISLRLYVSKLDAIDDDDDSETVPQTEARNNIDISISKPINMIPLKDKKNGAINSNNENKYSQLESYKVK